MRKEIDVCASLNRKFFEDSFQNCNRTYYCNSISELTYVLSNLQWTDDNVIKITNGVKIYVGYEGNCYLFEIYLSACSSPSYVKIIAQIFVVEFKELVVFGKDKWLVEKRTFKTFADNLEQVVKGLIMIPHASDFYL